MEEVYLWRGTSEQRARRRSSRNSGRFRYFDKQLDQPSWTGKSVLDFGGNRGDILADAQCKIRPQDYCCVDVLKEALAEGRRRFPQAGWVHYDRYNCSFNPNGVVGLPIPELGGTFDVILAYSVFTHTTREDMHDLVEQLRIRLAPGGTLAFTFIDPHHKSWPAKFEGNNLEWRLRTTLAADRASDVERLLERSRSAQWGALVGGSEFFVDANGRWRDGGRSIITYHVYYTLEFLQREFPGSVILPPVYGEMQHCCLVRRAGNGLAPDGKRMWT